MKTVTASVLLMILLGCRQEFSVTPPLEPPPQDQSVPGPRQIDPKRGKFLSFSADGYDFSWNHVEGRVKYVFEISRNEVFSSILYQQEGSDRVAHCNGLDYGTYYWRVSALLEDEEWTQWSSARAFTIIPVTNSND